MDPRQAGSIAAAVTSGGAAATATAAVACCVPVLSPLLVAALGASGAAWVGGLRPYAPYLLLGGLALLAYAHWRVYGPPRRCEMQEAIPPRRLWLARVALALLWLSTAVWAGAVVGYFVLG